jgi:hypothetical protein
MKEYVFAKKDYNILSISLVFVVHQDTESIDSRKSM